MLNNAQTSTKKPKLWLFILIMPLAAATILIITPALVDLKHFFHGFHRTATAIVSIAMLGYAVGPLLYGPIANAMGRKKTLYIGMTIALIGLILQWLSLTFMTSLSLFLIGRFITAIGAVAGLVMTYTMIADIYDATQTRKMTSYALMAFAIMPGIAVAIGGILTQHLGFIAIIYFSALYIIACLIAIFFAPESSPKTQYDWQALKPRKIAYQYLHLLTKPAYLIFYVLFGFGAAAIYIYGAQAPLTAIQLLKLTPSEFGYFGFFPYFAFMLALLITGKISHKVSQNTIFIIAILFMLIASIALTFITIFHDLNRFSFFLPIFLLFAGIGPTIANAAVKANSTSTDKSSASAFGCFIFMLIGAGGTMLGSFYPHLHPMLLPIALLFFSIIIIILFIAGSLVKTV